MLMVRDVTVFFLYLVSLLDSSQRNEQQAPTLSKKRGWKICNTCNQFSPPASKICKHDGCKAVFPLKAFNWDNIDSMGATNPTHQRELLEKRANILYKKHKWDVVVFYFHPHGKGDTISYYGTPGTAAKFLGLCQDDKKMHPAGKGALDLFESFVDRELKGAGTAAVTALPASTSRCTSTLSSATSTSNSTSAVSPSITTNATTTTPSTNSLASHASSTSPVVNPILSQSLSIVTSSQTTSIVNLNSPLFPTSNPLSQSTSSTPISFSAPLSSTEPFASSSSTPNKSSTGAIEKNVPAQASPVASTNLSINSSSSFLPATTDPSSSISQQNNEKRVAYVENSTVKALGVPLESRKVIHGKTIPEGSICVQVTYTSAVDPTSRHQSFSVIAKRTLFLNPTCFLLYQ